MFSIENKSKVINIFIILPLLISIIVKMMKGTSATVRRAAGIFELLPPTHSVKRITMIKMRMMKMAMMKMWMMNMTMKKMTMRNMRMQDMMGLCQQNAPLNVH